jgi:DNA-directed RNA polymerase sigma subunit (sigma70/sigma32)
MQDEERPGTPEELQEMLSKMGKDYSVDHIKKVSSAESRGIPLESNDPDETHSPIDWLNDESSATELTDLMDLSETVRVALSRLNFMQRDVVVRRLGLNGNEPENFSSIAERYDRTPEWARSLYVRCLKLMQVRLKSSKITRDRVLNHEV